MSRPGESSQFPILEFRFSIGIANSEYRRRSKNAERREGGGSGSHERNSAVPAQSTAKPDASIWLQKLSSSLRLDRKTASLMANILHLPPHVLRSVYSRPQPHSHPPRLIIGLKNELERHGYWHAQNRPNEAEQTSPEDQ